VYRDEVVGQATKMTKEPGGRGRARRRVLSAGAGDVGADADHIRRIIGVNNVRWSFTRDNS
jgi:hypothetical protein